MNRDHRKVVVKIKSNTRIVNIPLEQNNGWLDTLKMAVVKTFQDVLAHGEKETEFSLEKVADAFLFQVYDPEFEEFVDLTDETVLPRKARLKLQPIAKSYGNADRTAWSSKEMVSLLIISFTFNIYPLLKSSIFPIAALSMYFGFVN